MEQKTFRIIGNVAKDIFFQHKLMEKFIKNEIGYSFYNNEYQKWVYEDVSNEELVNSEVYKTIFRNSNSALNFYLDVLQNIGIDCVLRFEDSEDFIFAFNESILKCKKGILAPVSLSTGTFDEINNENLKNNALQIVNKKVEEAWNINSGVILTFS